MFPFFIDGDVLSIRKIRFEKIGIDDFVTFKTGRGIYITHRVIYKHPKKNYLITKGDTNLRHDGKVAAKQIVGKVVSVKRHGKIINIENIYFFQSSLYFEEIIKIAHLFSDRKIDFLVLKGLPLHLYFEKKIPSRIYADCDILIDKDKLHAVERIFKRQGYYRVKDELHGVLNKLKDKQIEISFRKFIHNIPVIFDVHLEATFLMTQLGSLNFLYPQEKINSFTKHLLANKCEIKINHENLPVLKTESLIIYLALHIFHHNFQGYNRYSLLLKILQGRKINFKKIAEIISEYRLLNFTLPVFMILKKEFFVKTELMNSSPIPIKTLDYIERNIMTMDIFNDEDRVSSGMRRFKNIYFLSPEPPVLKIFTFLSPQVLFSVYFSMVKKSRLLYLRYYFLFKQKVYKTF